MSKTSITINITIHVYNQEYILSIMQNIIGSLFVRPSFPRPYRYHEEDPPSNKTGARQVYPAYHEEDPPTFSSTPISDVISDVMSAKSLQGAGAIFNLLCCIEGTLPGPLDFNDRFDVSPSDSVFGGTYHETRIVKSVSVEAVDKCHHSTIMSSEPSTPLKAAHSVDRVDLASSAMPVADPGLKQAQSMDAVNKVGVRRSQYGFDDKWLTHLTSHASDVMDFGDDNDTWSQVSYESSMASIAADGGPVRNRPVLPTSVLSRRHSAGDKLDMQGASRRGLSNSMILTWLSNKRYVPTNEPISEQASDGAGSCTELDKLDQIDSKPPASTGLAALTGTSITNTPIKGTGLTAAATAMVAAGDVSKGLGGMEDKKKMKVNYRELNAYSPSCW